MKFILAILLGFMLHKGLDGIYNYYWWTSEYTCKDDPRNKDDYRICLYEDLGLVKNLSYILAGPHYSFRKWEWYH